MLYAGMGGVALYSVNTLDDGNKSVRYMVSAAALWLQTLMVKVTVSPMATVSVFAVLVRVKHRELLFYYRYFFTYSLVS